MIKVLEMSVDLLSLFINITIVSDDIVTKLNVSVKKFVKVVFG